MLRLAIAEPTFRRCLLPAIALVALAVLVTLPVAAGDWPQWRGPGGLGVADESGPLPVSWSETSPNVRWRTPIPGEGISSPIASNGRVFVTSAYEAAGGGEILVRAVTVLLVLALLAWVLLRGRRGVSRGVVVLSFLFALLALTITFRPDLFYEVGNPGRVWRTTGVAALIGLAAAFGWFRPGSRGRLLGAAVLVAAAFFIVRYTPFTQLGPAPLSKRLTFALPGIAAALVYALSYLRRRRSPASGGGGLLSASLLCLLALLVFVPPNYLRGLQRAVVSVDLASGEIAWQKAAFSAPAERKWERSTYATPTPAADGERVFAYFGAGLAALSFDGELEWVERFPGYSQHTRYGAGASPVLVGDTVVMVAESEAFQDSPPSWIAAFDKGSGRAAWRIEPPEARDSYGTPLVIGAGRERQIVTASWHHVAAYDASSGERLWFLPHPLEQVVASMGRAGDLAAVTGGTHGERVLIVIRLPGADGGEPEVLWESRKGVASISSPVFYGGMLFTLTDGGIMTCYDAETGDVLWKQRLKGDHYASLLAGDGKVYATNGSGATSVVAASEEYSLLAFNELGDAVYASPAVAGGCLLIRTTRELFCIEAEESAAG